MDLDFLGGAGEEKRPDRKINQGMAAENPEKD
jgi:hypothetical protein